MKIDSARSTVDTPWKYHTFSTTITRWKLENSFCLKVMRHFCTVAQLWHFIRHFFNKNILAFQPKYVSFPWHWQLWEKRKRLCIYFTLNINREKWINIKILSLNINELNWRITFLPSVPIHQTKQDSGLRLRKLNAREQASRKVIPGATRTLVYCWSGNCTLTTDRRGERGTESDSDDEGTNPFSTHCPPLSSSQSPSTSSVSHWFSSSCNSWTLLVYSWSFDVSSSYS